MDDLVKRLEQEASKNGNRQSDPAFTNHQRKKFRYRNHLLTNAANRIKALEAQLAGADQHEHNRIKLQKRCGIYIGETNND